MSNKGKGIRLIGGCYQARTGPIISLKDKELNPSGGYGNILHLYLETPLVLCCLFFGIKMRLGDGRLLPRLLGNLKTGIFSAPHSPLLLLIYPQPLCGLEYCKRCGSCYNWTVLNFSSTSPPTLTIKKKRHNPLFHKHYWNLGHSGFLPPDITTSTSLHYTQTQIQFPAFIPKEKSSCLFVTSIKISWF